MNRYQFRTALVLVPLSLLATGCGSKSNSGTAIPATAPQVVLTGPPVTADEAKQFGEALEKAIAANDRPSVEKLLHVGEIVDRCVSDLNPSASLVNGIKAAIATGGPIIGSLLSTVENGGSFKLLRVKNVDDSFRPVFRLLFPESGVNYFEFELARYPDGQVGMSDLHVAMIGEPFTQNIRRLTVPAIQEGKNGKLNRLSGRERPYLDNIQKFEEINKAVRTGQKAAAALATFRSLPAELQKEKTFQILALQLAQNVSEEDYSKEMKRFRETHPNDPAMDIISIDYLSVKKQFGKALECIDRLDRSVGGDPYLHCMRGNMHVMAEKWDDAKKSFQKAIQQEPTLHEPYWGMVGVLVSQKNYDETVVWLKKLVVNAEYDFDLDWIKSQELYRDFIKTPHFKSFETWYRERSKN